MGTNNIVSVLSRHADAATEASAAKSSCLGVDVTCYQMITDFLPVTATVGVLIGVLIAGIFTIKNANRQIANSRESHDRQLAYAFSETRYNAVRHKRAVAKALLQEVKLLKQHEEVAINVEKRGVIEPIVYPALLSEIGRLDTPSIESVVYFFGYHAWYFSRDEVAETTRPIDLLVVADTAINALSKFLDKTKPERDKAEAELKEYR